VEVTVPFNNNIYSTVICGKAICESSVIEGRSAPGGRQLI